jgi:CorA-like Mg2+ transporter protein
MWRSRPGDAQRDAASFVDLVVADSVVTVGAAVAGGRGFEAGSCRRFPGWLAGARDRWAADGELGYLHGVIEFYQTTLIVKSTLVGQRQNEEMQRMSRASYAQNEDVKKISAWAAIFFAPSLIGTVYGVNFEHMPELGWTVGCPLALLVMVLTSVVLYVVFKRIKWL